ncbi:BMC domain-containing protein [Thermovenabulum gondwanense]|uniref:BMC domain-containing protein n=1 Tax=Thermovenabulum gondwanense TaxID=520767 RepID=A0A161Q9H2_9FIRM|nr:BMC domain-containing protein [Thermovenabulum gondwanense]KYO64145.1 hypothetical protein ATZ99_21760 [Thermovenabulum gondwanense]
MSKAIGIVESTSIARGIEAADGMVKQAPVKLFIAKTICPGKFLILIGGDVEAVNSSVERGEGILGEFRVDSVVIPNVHENVLLALEGTSEIKYYDRQWALGVIETFSVTACIYAADAAVKAGGVQLIEVRPAVGLGGKSFVTMIGDVSAVESAVNAGRDKIKDEGMMLNFAVIPYISEDVLCKLI